MYLEGFLFSDNSSFFESEDSEFLVLTGQNKGFKIANWLFDLKTLDFKSDSTQGLTGRKLIYFNKDLHIFEINENIPLIHIWKEGKLEQIDLSK